MLARDRGWAISIKLPLEIPHPTACKTLESREIFARLYLEFMLIQQNKFICTVSTILASTTTSMGLMSILKKMKQKEKDVRILMLYPFQFGQEFTSFVK